MKTFQLLVLLGFISSCTTIHFRSKGEVPVSFEGNPKQTREVSVVGHRSFYFWGLEPDEHVVYIDEEVRKAGYDGISKLIIYEQKNPQDMLISILTLGLYLPRGYTITGFTSKDDIPEVEEEEIRETLEAPETKKADGDQDLSDTVSLD